MRLTFGCNLPVVPGGCVKRSLPNSRFTGVTKHRLTSLKQTLQPLAWSSGKQSIGLRGQSPTALPFKVLKAQAH